MVKESREENQIATWILKCLQNKMTLETAKRIVEEQGDLENKEAQAVVRGGMNICEQTNDGRRVYKWIKVYPTKTDMESSIIQALRKTQVKKTQKPKDIPKRQEPVLPSAVHTPIVPASRQTESSNDEIVNTLNLPPFLLDVKKKLCDLWDAIDQTVKE